MLARTRQVANHQCKFIKTLATPYTPIVLSFRKPPFALSLILATCAYAKFVEPDYFVVWPSSLAYTDHKRRSCCVNIALILR